MPIYEYRCRKCHTVFEEWLKHATEDTGHHCPKCSGAAERIISNTSFMLKGGGWYATEYGNRKNESCGADCPKTDSAPAAAPSCSAACGGASCPAD